MVLEYTDGCQQELQRKEKYSKEEAKEALSILSDFGYSKGSVSIPDSIITKGQLENWKKEMINTKLSSMRVSKPKALCKRKG